MKPIIYLFVVIVLLSNCGKDSDGNDGSCQTDGKVNIRIHNLSAFEIIDFNYDNIETFDTILPGATTSYMQLETANDVPWTREMTINGSKINQRLIDGLGLNVLEEGCYTYLHYAVEYDDGDIFSGGKVYNNFDLIDFDPINQDCIELEKTDCLPDSDKANVRIKNATAFDLCNLEIKINNIENASLGNLLSGDTTCYISFNTLKKYPLECKFDLGDEEFIIENPTYHERLENLSPGYYTYNISIIGPHIKLGDIQMSTN